MVLSTLKSKIDSLWLDFHAGGITNPITVIEQISFLMFIRLLDIEESRKESRAAKLGRPYKGLYSPEQQHLRWCKFRHLGGEKLLETVRDKVFPFLRTEIEKQNDLGRFLRDANCLVPSGNLLVKAVNAIEELPLNQGDTKGDLYEYLLSKLSTAGIAGQFRTPRHIIRTMVEMVDPKPMETVCDPACGTAGFLVGVMDYLKRTHTTPALVEEEVGLDGEIERHYPGDRLEPYREHIRKHMFCAFDFDSTMLRTAAMNLLLHGVESNSVLYQDTLNKSFSERQPQHARDAFDLILANPPFKGNFDEDSLDSTLKSKVKTKKTELLFLVLILRMLRNGGRCAVIVPDGVLFGSGQAHVGVRSILLDENQLEGVISLPSGVFKPYAGVSTAILLFTKGGRTDHVWFYKVTADGLSLDDNRRPVAENDLPDLVKQWKRRSAKRPGQRTEKCFFVPADEIRANAYDLSLNRYSEVIHEEVHHTPPREILATMRALEKEILRDMEQLESLLGKKA